MILITSSDGKKALRCDTLAEAMSFQNCRTIMLNGDAYSIVAITDQSEDEWLVRLEPTECSETVGPDRTLIVDNDNLLEQS